MANYGGSSLMIISCDNEEFTSFNFYEFKEIVIQNVKQYSTEEVWLSKEKNDYPCLSILINQNKAVVNYFESEDSGMYASLGNVNNNEIIEFRTKVQVYEIVGYQVIPFEIALKCAEAFYRQQELPTCIEWEEL